MVVEGGVEVYIRFCFFVVFGYKFLIKIYFFLVRSVFGFLFVVSRVFINSFIRFNIFFGFWNR